MKEFIKEFKEFAFKGNMMDLAVGMIIGAAFTALVNSVVSNLFMPLISVFTGGIDFSNLYLPLSEASKEAFVNGADIATARSAGAVLPYGPYSILNLSIRCILNDSRIDEANAKC